MAPLTINGINLGFYPDEGDAGGTKSYLSDLNDALSRSWPTTQCRFPVPTINVVGWYAQTYPGEEFTGFQFMPLVEDVKAEFVRCRSAREKFVYEASVMPFQSWTGYTAGHNGKAKEVAKVMRAMLDKSKTDDGGEFAIGEIRLRFGHEVNYYIKSGLYPPPTNPADPGKDYREAFDQVALAVRDLPSEYRERIKMFWCPNIASTSSGASEEYAAFLPTLEYIDYVGIDYYCPSPGNLNASDFVRKMKKVHDKYAGPTRPFILGETGLHFDENEGGGMEAKLRWLEVVMGKEARRGLKWMVGVSWFNYEKDRDYRLIEVVRQGSIGKRGLNGRFVEWIKVELEKEHRGRTGSSAEGEKGGKVKKFWKTLLAK